MLRDGGARVLIHSVDEPKLRNPGPKSGDASPIKVIPELWHPTLWMMMARLVREGGANMIKIEGAEKFSEGETLDVPGRPRVIATPGHTPGHSAFHFEGHGALFVGDALCTWSPASGSRGAQLMPRFMNESHDQSLASLGALDSVEADVLLPGHGEPWREGVAEAVHQARDRAQG